MERAEFRHAHYDTCGDHVSLHWHSPCGEAWYRNRTYYLCRISAQPSRRLFFIRRAEIRHALSHWNSKYWSISLPLPIHGEHLDRICRADCCPQPPGTIHHPYTLYHVSAAADMWRSLLSHKVSLSARVQIIGSWPSRSAAHSFPSSITIPCYYALCRISARNTGIFSRSYFPPHHH